MGTLDPVDCGCVTEECSKECAGWGEWSDWTPWMPECIDNAGGTEDTLFDDQEIHQPKRFRSRDCFLKDANGILTTQEVPVSKSLGECLFADKFETEFQPKPKQCEPTVIPPGEIETKVLKYVQIERLYTIIYFKSVSIS